MLVWNTFSPFVPSPMKMLVWHPPCGVDPPLGNPGCGPMIHTGLLQMVFSEVEAHDQPMIHVSSSLQNFLACPLGRPL